MPILPNDVSWLASLGHVDFTTKEGLIVSKIRILNGFIVNVAATFALFSLEGEETVDGGLHLIQKLLGVMKPFNDFGIYFLVFSPFLLPDVLTSLGQTVNYLGVVKSKGNDSNFDRCFITFVTIDTQAWEISQSLFHFIFDIGSELANL